MSIKKTVAILAAAGALTAVALPALADVTPYASVRVGTFWDTHTAGYAANVSAPDSTTDFVLGLNGTSRFGATFSNGNLAGKVELGIGAFNVKTDSASYGNGGATEVYTREAYGTYKFDFGTLLVGQTYTPYTVAAAQVTYDDNVGNGFGSLYDGRQPQVKLTLNNGLYVAAIRNGGAAANANAGDTSAANSAAETLLPKVAVGYEGKAGALAFGVGVAGQTFVTSPSNVVANKVAVNSLLGYAHGTYTDGLATLAFNLGVGQNAADFGLSGVSSASTATAFNKATFTGSSVNDVTQYSAFVQGTYQVAPSVKTNVGVGYVVETAKAFVKDDNRIAAFVNAPITLAKNVTIVPEIAYIDLLDQTDGSKGFKDVVYGAKWQFDF